MKRLKINRKGRIEVLKKGQKMLQRVQSEVFYNKEFKLSKIYKGTNCKEDCPPIGVSSYKL